MNSLGMIIASNRDITPLNVYPFCPAVDTQIEECSGCSRNLRFKRPYDICSISNYI